MAESFGRWVRTRREAMGLTQTELGIRAGVSAGTVSRWESGTRITRRPIVIALAEALETPADELLEMAGFSEHAARWREEQAAEHEPLGAIRRELARLPMRPAARGALLKLMAELSEEPQVPRVWRPAFERAKERAREPIGAGIDLDTEAWVAIILERLERYFAEELAREDAGLPPT